ncbi:hypothetical protein FS749_007441 [Ceratobasidium sp. UAMH 11750]|nr:hypothetical protein FS749_007441 [Ceratobasidium sp. UAMH 11750]
MEVPKRKITAKVNPDAAPSPIPTRPPSQASNARASRLGISSPSPSPPAAIRPKAKISSSATVGSLKVVAAKSPGSAISNGRKTPVSSVTTHGSVQPTYVSDVTTLPTSKIPPTSFNTPRNFSRATASSSRKIAGCSARPTFNVAKSI